MRRFGRNTIRLASLTTGILLAGLAWAGSESQLTNISLSTKGEIIITASGEGFDPQLRTRPLPDGRYEIIISAPQVEINGSIGAQLETGFQRQIPAIEKVRLSDVQNGFQLRLTSWQRLQPQVQSNAGNRIVITLIGDHQLPASVMARQERDAEAKRQADIQAKGEEERKVRLQEEIAEKEKLRQAALEKQQVEAASLKQKRADEDAILQARRQAELTNQLRRKNETGRLANFQVSQRSRLPSISPGRSPIETDWQTAYQSPPSALQAIQDDGVPVTVSGVNKPVLKNYDIGFPKRINQPFTPKAQVHEVIPTSGKSPSAFDFGKLASEMGEVYPPEPLRLRKTPAGYNPDGLPQASSSGKNERLPSLKLDNYSEYETTSQEPVIRRALEDLRNGRLDNAEIGLRNFIDRESGNGNFIEARYLLALTLSQPREASFPASEATDHSRLEAAQRELMVIINQRPFLPAYLRLIELALARQQLDKAEQFLGKAFPLYPEVAMLWFQKGRLLEARKDWPEAKSAYMKALLLDAGHPEFHYRLAQTHLKLENWNACRRELLQTLTILPDDARCWKLLGYLAEKRGDFQQASSLYRASLQPDVMIHYGRLLEKQNDPKRALMIYQAVESVAEKDADLLFNLGMVYVQAGQPARAERVLKRFLKLSPNAEDPRVEQAWTTLKQARR